MSAGVWDFNMLPADKAEQVIRRGFLIKADGEVWRVPRELWDIYRENWPELGMDAPRWRGVFSEEQVREIEGLPPKGGDEEGVA